MAAECLRVCSAGDVHFRLQEIRAFMFTMKAREPASTSAAEMKGHVCVHVCLELKGQGEKENRCYRFALTSKYA